MGWPVKILFQDVFFECMKILFSQLKNELFSLSLFHLFSEQTPTQGNQSEKRERPLLPPDFFLVLMRSNRLHTYSDSGGILCSHVLVRRFELSGSSHERVSSYFYLVLTKNFVAGQKWDRGYKFSLF